MNWYLVGALAFEAYIGIQLLREFIRDDQQ